MNAPSPLGTHEALRLDSQLAGGQRASVVEQPRSGFSFSASRSTASNTNGRHGRAALAEGEARVVSAHGVFADTVSFSVQSEVDAVVVESPMR